MGTALRAVALGAVFSLLLPATGRGDEQTANPESDAPELEKLSLEALMDLQVTSVSKKKQSLATAAAAVFVITGDDIRRSGATNIAEALRMAPGVQVARIDANKWAVSIRGFNGRFANKLLVLMDGRSLYTPLFSGVFWEVQDTALEDIDRIEVIRGPGASLWGANAVNGVINIITRSAGQTPGGLVSAGGGSEERGFATARYGVAMGEATDVRLFFKYLNRDTFVKYGSSDDRASDAWNMTRGGFRVDSQPTDHDTLTVQGEYYDGTFHETYEYLFPPPAFVPPLLMYDTTSRASGGNILSRWERKYSDKSGLSLQFYYDHAERSMYIMSEKRDTLDLEFQHRISLGKVNDVIWGLGYRFSHDETGTGTVVTFDPSRKDDHLCSAFIHDEISLVPDRLSLILGSRFEHNDYSGIEIQPNGRLIYTPSPRHTLWGSVSRSVRTPARVDRDMTYYQYVVPGTGGATIYTINGSKDFRSEEVMAYELGYRLEPHPALNLDLATFYNEYDHLRSVRSGSSTAPPFVIQQVPLANDIRGHSVGAEFAAQWQVAGWWRLRATYSYLKITSYVTYADPHPAVADYNSRLQQNMEGSSPRNQFSLRSGVDLGRQVEFDLWLRGADRLRYIDTITIPGYVTLDVRLAWKPVKGVELALVGQNLFHDHRPEFRSEIISTMQTETPRGFYGKLTWQF